MKYTGHIVLPMIFIGALLGQAKGETYTLTEAGRTLSVVVPEGFKCDNPCTGRKSSQFRLNNMVIVFRVWPHASDDDSASDLVKRKLEAAGRTHVRYFHHSDFRGWSVCQTNSCAFELRRTLRSKDYDLIVAGVCSSCSNVNKSKFTKVFDRYREQLTDAAIEK